MTAQKPDRKVCLVRTLVGDDDWVATFVIDGRKYPTVEDFARVKLEAFDEINTGWKIVSEFETRVVGPNEPEFPYPSWEEYRAALEGGELGVSRKPKRV
ncbi:hypothetical protein [Nocardia sp. NPDC058666]|uniref:hypothetical protein n=1 Tax=unclassified Nocardia TaxID=2637762 RepID=UPI00365F3CDE